MIGILFGIFITFFFRWMVQMLQSMSMHLYNTLTRQIEQFTPNDSNNNVSLYACGLTVYDYTHLGHLRKYTLDDVLVRTLRHAGYKVKFVQNITDVGHLVSDADEGEDKLEKGAKKYNKSVWDIAKEFEEYFFKSMDSMGNLRPDISCRATEHIEAQIALVKKLEEKGFTYKIENDGIYFDTSKLTDYGKLNPQSLGDLKEGERIGVVAGKKNPTDFALWKFERPGENRQMIWSSPWSERGFPGWHIECSAMSMQYLGEQIAIHTGGIDHIPVHHTNEIAQSEAATGKVPFVRYWVHHNHLQVDGEKMSKSLGNFFTIDDVIERGFNPRALRLLFLQGHYRDQMNFTWDSLSAAQKAWERLNRLLQTWGSEQVGLSATGIRFQRTFFTALEDDLKTAQAVATVWVMAKSDLPDGEKLTLFKQFDEILQLGFGAESKVEPSDVVRRLITEREQARNKSDWKLADALREKLAALGHRVVDSK